MRVLLVEDEVALAEWLNITLAQQAIFLDCVDRAALALHQLTQTNYDLMLLDLGLPDMDGQDFLLKVRQHNAHLPILVLTARDSLNEKVRSLKHGADDFLAKPFEIEELEARIEALVRRAQGNESPRFACGALYYNVRHRQFYIDNTVLSLSAREHSVLKVLIQHPTEPLDKFDIHHRIFSDDADTEPDAIEVIIFRLRKRLQGCSVHIRHVRGLGYVLENITP